MLLSLTYDLRLAGGGKSANVTPGQVVNLELFAVVTGADANASNEGYQNGWGSILSKSVSGATNLKGTLAATLTPTFNANSAQPGAQADLDGDGDLDVGSNDANDHSGYFFARAAARQNGGQFKIANVKFTVAAGAAAGAKTAINFRNSISSLWWEDNLPKYTNIATPKVGSAVTLSIAGGGGGDTTPPTVSGFAANALTNGGGASYQFTVTYADNKALKVSTLGTGDVKVIGPNGFSQNATFVSVNNNTNGTPRTATYKIAAPGGFWDSIDNGNYTIKLQGNQVSDAGGNFAAAATVGTFNVNVPFAVLGPGGALQVNGTSGNDTINLSARKGVLTAKLNTTTKTFSTKSVKKISVRGGAGNDVITLGAGIIGANVHGDAGNDRINGGPGNDSIFGDGGVDSIFGNGGADSLFTKGDHATDQLDGGAGIDGAQTDKGEHPTHVEKTIK
jgi:hypothetical protein